MKDPRWIWRWTKIAGGFSALQAVLQVLNALTGFLLVRAMGKEDYAWFTVVNSLLATVSILTDSGLGSAFSSLGGPVCTDQPRFAALLAVTRRYRLLFMALSLLVTLPAGAWALHLNQAPPWTNALLLLIVVTSAVPAAEIAVLAAANRLRTHLRQILAADATLSVTRLVLVYAGRYGGGMGALLASAIGALAQWLQWLVLRRQTRDLRAATPAPDESFRKPMLDVVKHMLPICIFQCVQGHITTWILSVAGSSSDVADVGALARLGILMTFLFVPFNNFVFPAIARATSRGRLLHLAYLTVGLALVIAAALIGTGLWLWKPLLWLFGPQYGHLQVELAWYMAHIALGFIGHVLWGIVLTRSWVRHGWMHIPITILIQTAGAFWLDLATTTGAIQFAALSHLAGIGVAAVLAWRGIHRLPAAS